MEANYGANQIQSLLQKVKIFNKEIGKFEIFAITENFDYAVKLSNGKINLKVEDLQDDERDCLTPERLKAISERFIPSNTNQQTVVTPQQVNSQSSSAPPKTSTNQMVSKNKGNTGLIVGVIIGGVVLVVGIIVGVMFIGKSGRGSSSGDIQTYEQKVMTVEEIERANPSQFLDASGNYRENFWGDAMKVEGVIKNTATVANYKDVVVEVIFYSDTDTELERKQYTIYEFVPAHSSVSFKLKLARPQACKKLGWNAITATPY